MSDVRIGDLAYMAGFFDGEGCITFQKTNKSKNYQSYSPVVCCVNNSISLLTGLQKSFGGKIYKRKPKSEKHSVSYCLSFTKQSEMLSFLKLIKPFLRLKNKQAEDVCEFIESRLLKINIRGQNYPLTDREIHLMRKVRNENGIASKKTVLTVERLEA